MLPVRLVDNRPHGVRAAAAFGAATPIDLPGIAQRGVSRVHCVANIPVAEDITGADDHEIRRKTLSDTASPIGDEASARGRLQTGGDGCVLTAMGSQP